MLYPSGPLMDFMTDLQEISPENLMHRLQVLEFINQLLKMYESLKIYYKHFPGTLHNDPIKEYCSEYLKKNRIQLIKVAPLKFYNHVDLVLGIPLVQDSASVLQPMFRSLCLMSSMNMNRHHQVV